MIVPMLKYTFLVFHKEYKSFLDNLQELGVVHVHEKDSKLTDEIKFQYAEINEFQKAIQFLQKKESIATDKNNSLSEPEIVQDILKKQIELVELCTKLDEIRKLHCKALSWGNFEPELIRNLEAENIFLHFYSVNKKKYDQLNKEGLPLEILSEYGNQLRTLIIGTGKNKIEIDAEELKLPAIPHPELKKQMDELESKIEKINLCFEEYASNSITKLKKYKAYLINALNVDTVVLNTSKEAEDKLMVLEGWIPITHNFAINQYLENNEILYVSRKASPNDTIPVLLKNNRFSRHFEPIGSMFSLPDYAELDLTVFFAPFFMLFFGFCLGDAGYGFLFLVGAGLYKLKAKYNLKPYLTLLQFLGVATIVFGTISGTFLGVNLIETEINLIANFRGLFLNPDKMFNLALILGGIQIIFGMFIKAANQTKQFGFHYALATLGWLTILIGSIVYILLSGSKIIPTNKTILYVILAVGGFFILFFSDPSVSMLARVGKGVWDIYSTVTGIFGDLLSYIRLFALGLSSAILGFVINDIGIQILASSKILGPVFFVLFLIIGHTLNILISSLGSFVHPMRLTFVEFYKSAGFKGGGKQYKPFTK